MTHLSTNIFKICIYFTIRMLSIICLTLRLFIKDQFYNQMEVGGDKSYTVPHKQTLNVLALRTISVNQPYVFSYMFILLMVTCILFSCHCTPIHLLANPSINKTAPNPHYSEHQDICRRERKKNNREDKCNQEIGRIT